MKQRIITLNEFVEQKQINEASKQVYDYSCLMVNVNTDGWDNFIHTLVDANDLYTEEEDYGFETEPHVTVLYGLHADTDMEKLKSMLPSLSTIELSSDAISIFENPKYDVLKYDIQGDNLFKLNKEICENFEYTSDFPDYHPHITIAYLKPGCGKKYAKELTEPKQFNPEVYTYSHTTGEKEFINI
ncbi:MAG: 2'-5' RNA ligase family protein [Candidatus Pacearchaeota archaeon]|jgi:hypothetical protein|nr:2'-5' RNA ligase family protein [Clostridia bacterium]